MASIDTSREIVSVFKKRLSENAVVVVQRQGTADSERHQGILIGNIGDEHLVLGGFDAVHFAVNERIVVRMVKGNHVVGFGQPAQFRRTALAIDE